jgi:hypothetical protein
MRMKRHADIYDGHRSKDWLERQHIKKVRSVIRAARKRESQLDLDKPGKRVDQRETV